MKGRGGRDGRDGREGRKRIDGIESVEGRDKTGKGEEKKAKKGRKDHDGRARAAEIKKAVALQYDHRQDNAPVITASGSGEIAARILEEARKHNIPIREDRDIVEVLARLNIGEEIPPELYQAIAEILSFIYLLEEK